jgi:hypothetical protein
MIITAHLPIPADVVPRDEDDGVTNAWPKAIIATRAS